MTRFILCGTGWRAQFYMRIAAALSDRFSIVGVYTRNEGRASELSKEGWNASTDLEALLSIEHDAVIVSSGASGYMDLMRRLRSREKVFTETTFLSLSYEEQEELIDMDGLCLEQYWYTPLYASMKKALPLIGKVSQVYLSALHNHHAASIVREIYSIEDESPEVMSYDFSSQDVRTGARSGRIYSGEMEDYTRKLRIMSFSGNRLFINDFSTNQYHSHIVPSRFEIRGERGVITEGGVIYLDENNRVIKEDFVFYRDSEKINRTLALSHVSLGSRVVFENPYPNLNLDDDEIAIAYMLEEASKGRILYSIRDGILDARLGKRL